MTTTSKPNPTRQFLDALEGRVQSRLGNRVRHFRCVWTPHGLILQGQTQTYYDKQLVQHMILEEAEWPVLANQIEIQA